MATPSAAPFCLTITVDFMKKNGFFPVRRLSQSPWLGAGTAVLAAAAAMLAKVQSDGWALPAVLALLAAGGVGLTFVGARSKQQEANQEILRDTSSAPLIEGSLPTVNQVGLDAFRVHAAGVDLPYLRRDRQSELHDRLVEGLPVLVVGHSMSGKTRMALEMVRQLYGSWPVWIPARPDGVGELLAKGQPRNAVVWLDYLESLGVGADVNPAMKRVRCVVN
jgi:hypothetical protein